LSPSGSSGTGSVHPGSSSNGMASVHPDLVQPVLDSDYCLDLDSHPGSNQSSGSGHTGSGRSSGSHPGQELYPGFQPDSGGPDMSVVKNDTVDRNHYIGKIKIKNIFDISPIRPVEGETCEIV
jgi:hypothetical protein